MSGPLSLDLSLLLKVTPSASKSKGLQQSVEVGRVFWLIFMNINSMIDGMKYFRSLLVLQFLLIVTYTVAVGTLHGWDLLPQFFGDILRFNWSGQFNVDFFFMLTLSSLWACWRNNFGIRGLAFGAAALFGGISFLAPYLLYLSVIENGDVHRILTRRS